MKYRKRKIRAIVLSGLLVLVFSVLRLQKKELQKKPEV